MEAATETKRLLEVPKENGQSVQGIINEYFILLIWDAYIVPECNRYMNETARYWHALIPFFLIFLCFYRRDLKRQRLLARSKEMARKAIEECDNQTENEKLVKWGEMIGDLEKTESSVVNEGK